MMCVNLQASNRGGRDAPRRNMRRDPTKQNKRLQSQAKGRAGNAVLASKLEEKSVRLAIRRINQQATRADDLYTKDAMPAQSELAVMQPTAMPDDTRSSRAAAIDPPGGANKLGG